FLLSASAALDCCIAQQPPPPPDLGTRKQGEDWPTFLGPNGNSRSSETGFQMDWNQHPPKVLWDVEVGASYAICSISRGRCFVFDRVEDTARLRCLNSETGKPLWQYTYPTKYEDMLGYNNGPRCAPITDGRLVYIFGVDGQLHCVKASDGKRVWAVDTAEDYGVVQNFFGVGSTPAIYNDMLLVMIGGSPDESHGFGQMELDRVVGEDSGIVAFDRFTGKERYRLTDELASYASMVTARINDRDWAFAFARGGLVGFNPANGKLDFRFPWRARILESVNASTPVIVGNEVLITETYGPGGCLLAVGPDGKNRVVWKDERGAKRSMAAHWNTPVHHKGYIYGSSGRHSQPAELRCVDWKTGKVQWSKPGLARASLLYVDGHLICLSENGVLRSIEATPEAYREKGKLEWADENGRALLRYPAWSAPILSHGLLYVRGNDRLVCAELTRSP
ncbi:MAG: PQQ-binding-like beta-propeller repeat protein, partial [Planctomycetota bacterium]